MIICHIGLEAEKSVRKTVYSFPMCGVCSILKLLCVVITGLTLIFFNAKRKLSEFLCYLYYVHLEVFFYSLCLNKTEVYVVNDDGMT